MRRSFGSALSLACLVMFIGSLSAQSIRTEVHKARLSIPFGEVQGTMVKIGEYLIFVDEDQPDNSFAIRRSDVRNIAAQDTRVTIDLTSPVRDRSGDRTSITFELQDPARAMTLAAWPQNGTAMTEAGQASTATNAGQPSTDSQTANGVIASYPVTHGHSLFGNCHGRLIVRRDIIAYESIDKLEDSRQWALRDIRELKLDNPYELSIKPFRGDDYSLAFDGKGMDNAVYRQLVERVTSSRSAE